MTAPSLLNALMNPTAPLASDPDRRKALFDAAADAIAESDVERLQAVAGTQEARELGVFQATLNVSGSTLLMQAARFGSTQCVQWLLPYSEVLRRNNAGQTALCLAVLSENEACVRLLLPLSDPNHADWEGLTPLMQAVHLERPSLVILLRPHSHVQQVDRNGWGAIMYAAVQANVHILRLLLPPQPDPSPDAPTLEAFDLAFHLANDWACKDALAPFATRDNVLAMLAEAPKTAMLSFRALLEREHLQRAVSPLPASARAPAVGALGASDPLPQSAPNTSPLANRRTSRL